MSIIQCETDLTRPIYLNHVDQHSLELQYFCENKNRSNDKARQSNLTLPVTLIIQLLCTSYRKCSRGRGFFLSLVMQTILCYKTPGFTNLLMCISYHRIPQSSKTFLAHSRSSSSARLFLALQWLLRVLLPSLLTECDLPDFYVVGHLNLPRMASIWYKSSLWIMCPRIYKFVFVLTKNKMISTQFQRMSEPSR